MLLSNVRNRVSEEEDLYIKSFLDDTKLKSKKASKIEEFFYSHGDRICYLMEFPSFNLSSLENWLTENLQSIIIQLYTSHKNLSIFSKMIDLARRTLRSVDLLREDLEFFSDFLLISDKSEKEIKDTKRKKEEELQKLQAKEKKKIEKKEKLKKS